MAARLKQVPEAWLAMGVISLIGLLSYLPPLGQLGFYWDDWYFSWLGHSEGARGIYENLVQERVLTALLFSGSYQVLGNHPLGWHLVELLLRLASGWAFWWMLRELWSEQRLASLLGGSLFVAYAGYWGQPYALALHNYLVALLLGVLSVACSLRAVNSPHPRARWGFMLGAVVSELGYLFTLEGFIGLEALRFMLLGYQLYSRTPAFKPMLRQLVPWMALYSSMIVVFLLWQSLFTSSSTRSDMNLSDIAQLYKDDPLGRAQWVAYEVGRDFAIPTFTAWTEAWFETSSSTPTPLKRGYLLYALLGMVSLGGVAWLKRKDDPSTPEWAKAAACLGIIGTAALILPLTLVLRDILLGTRDILAASVGAVLLVLGLSYTLLPRQAAATLLILLTGLSIFTQLNVSYPYKLGWEQQRNLWWQLSWRAPQLGAGTVLVVNTTFAWEEHLQDYQLAAPANFIYAYDTRQTRLNSTQLDEADLPFIQTAGWRLEMNFANTLLLYLKDEASCLRVIDNTRLYELPHTLSDLARAAAPFSRTDLILLNEPPARPPAAIFGDEPPHEWCYLFQKAELARQQEDWSTVAELGTLAQDFSPGDASEWLPFLEGYIHTQQLTDASELIQTIIVQDPTQDSALCTLLDRFRTPPTARQAWINDTAAYLTCFDLYTVWSEFIDPNALVFYPANTYQLPIETPLPGLVREIDLPPAAAPHITAWRSSKAAQNLQAAGISYLLLDQTWWQYADAQAIAMLEDTTQYTLIHHWEQPRTGKFYRLYRVGL